MRKCFSVRIFGLQIIEDNPAHLSKKGIYQRDNKQLREKTRHGRAKFECKKGIRSCARAALAA